MQERMDGAEQFNAERLQVKIYSERQKMGLAAGKAIANRIRELLQKQHSITMVFAAAPSQNELLQALANEPGIAWERIIAFHMDEYVGLAPDSPQRFQKYLKDRIFDPVKPGQVHYMNPSAASPEAERQRYAQLLLHNPLDLVLCGIGENGHLAFNDPDVADFLDPEIVKIVGLDAICRQQQVNDGCFASLDLVPTQALTLTIPVLFSARYLYCVVPGSAKAAAVHATLLGPVNTACPASVLRRHPRAQLYLDAESAQDLPDRSL